MKRIDLNCDMGESFGAWTMGDDASIMPLITSANVAAGFHAGDPGTIRATVQLAVDHGVAVGAHPSLPDLAGFGRRVMKVSPRETHDLIVYQAGAVAAFARAAGARLHHVKPHGALYNMAARDTELADAIAAAVKDLGDGVLLYGLAGSAMIEAAARHGVRAVQEVFADRTYQPDGSLTSRGMPNAMVTDEHAAVAQALAMVEEGRVRATDGSSVAVVAGTLCLHGDQPGAFDFARALRAAFSERGIALAAPD
ncbi:MAG TPA: 5-oxoprolinase subunit PxpA [Burkholderiaceae bacterium]|nr:5-oxoprolinase subunit PxpA [Burkholderiaceae bacterium]